MTRYLSAAIPLALVTTLLIIAAHVGLHFAFGASLSPAHVVEWIVSGVLIGGFVALNVQEEQITLPAAETDRAGLTARIEALGFRSISSSGDLHVFRASTLTRLRTGFAMPGIRLWADAQSLHISGPRRIVRKLRSTLG